MNYKHYSEINKAMKTNEEKLKILLEVAVGNGWKPYSYFIDLFEINRFQCKFEIAVIEDNQVYFRPIWDISFDEMSISLNDLVTNWEEGEISFIDALVNAHKIIKPFEHIGNPYIECSWNLKEGKPRPISKRLDWLFETFNHLL